jgi:hypothetical protein
MAVRFSHFVPVETPVAPSQPSFQAKARQKTTKNPAINPHQPAQDQLRLSTKHTHPAIKFGSGNQDDDVSFSKLFGMGKKLAKKTYAKTKEKVKKELNKPGSEKKAAAVAGVGAFIVAEAATGFSSLGVAGATAASAASGYVLTKQAKKHEQKKQAQQQPPVPPQDDQSDS